MRHVPHPVVVLTAASPSSSHGLPSQPLGIAVSSFNTVTLDPPTISFNIRRPSQTLSAIHADGGRFRVHFLAPRAKSARIAGLFTQGNHEEAYRLRREIMGMSLDLEVGRGSGGGGGGRAAKIVDECVVACLECVLVKEVEVGDHVIAVAGVERIEARENNEPVLSYVRGKYVHEGVDLLGEIESEIVAEEVEDKKGSKG
jgi:flavin reductase (DIM6/NTAB) family NADH-FMN oxidoreductase RutF